MVTLQNLRRNYIAKLVIIVGIIHIVGSSCPAVKQNNGFYVLKLQNEENRESVMPSIKPPKPTDLNVMSLTVRPIPLLDALTCVEFFESPIVTDLLNPQKFNLSEDSRSIIANTNGGGILKFGALKIVKSFKAFHALQVMSETTPNGSDTQTPIQAYWLPQGGYVDVPTIPKEDDPQYVFTVALNGGSLAADAHNATMLRIHHVAGGKENNENENKGGGEHGYSSAYGMAGRLLHSDYGFYVNMDNCKYVENGRAFAFIRFDNAIKHWVVTFQSILHNPVINEISFAQRNNWKVKTEFSSTTKIVNVDSKILGTHTDYDEKAVENRCFYGSI